MPKIEDWLRMYGSDELEIRWRAANVLLDRSEDAPLKSVIDILVSLSHHGLGAKAEKALLRRRDTALVPQMIYLLASSDSFVREVACNVLGRAGDKTATPHLLRMVDDPAMMVRRAAGFGLAFLNDKSVLSQVQELHLRHWNDDTNVVMALECALKNLTAAAGVEL